METPFHIQRLCSHVRLIHWLAANSAVKIPSQAMCCDMCNHVPHFSRSNVSLKCQQFTNCGNTSENFFQSCFVFSPAHSILSLLNFCCLDSATFARWDASQCLKLAPDWYQRQAHVNSVIDLRVQQKERNFLTKSGQLPASREKQCFMGCLSYSNFNCS